MSRIKARAGSLVAALSLATLPVREQETQRFPSLGAVQLAADGDGLFVTVTTFDATITVRAEADAEGVLAVPLDRLAGLVRHFPVEAEITITAEDHTATIVWDARSHFKLPVLPIADLPKRHVLGEETGRVELDAKAARDLFSRAAFAASTEKTRLYLAGIFLHNVGDDLAAVGADGYRFGRFATPAATILSTDRSLIVPTPMVKIIDHLIGIASGDVTLRRSERLFSVEGAGFALVTQRIDATYPVYETWIRPETANVVVTNRAKLREAVARFAAVADPQTRMPIILLRWDADGLHLNTPDGSEDCLAAKVDGEAETAVSVRYLADLVAAVRGDTIRLSAESSGSILLVTDPDDGNFLAGQMPRRWP